MTTLREAAQQALEALIWTTGSADFGEGGKAREGALNLLFPAITALLDALAEPTCQESRQVEPAAVWELQESGWEIICDGDWVKELPLGTKLYTASPKRKPLTDEEIKRMAAPWFMTHYWNLCNEFARAIERAHGIGGEE